MIVKRERPAKELYPFQNQAVRALLGGKHLLVSGMGSGKSSISVVWSYFVCKHTGKHKVLVITTSSKSKTKDEFKRNDFEAEMDNFCPPHFRDSITLEVVSWDLLYKWVRAHVKELSEWVVVADEVAKIKGFTSRRAKAFLALVERNPDWAGFTGTPGDTWESFGAYFKACGLVRHKTEFVRRFCIVQTFKGFPEIVDYRDEELLKRWWAEISYAPDTSQMTRELPAETHKTIQFKSPSLYKQVLKTREIDGEFIDNPSKLASVLRQLCFTKEKQQWVADFLEGLGEPAILFYNFIVTGDELEKIAKKALPKDARVWRIDGRHHEIPTEKTLGPRDIVLAQWQSGSEALNFQMMRTWVAVEPTYAYSTWAQAEGRIRRIGQKRNMFYFSLLCEKTIDADVYKCLQEKREFSEEIWLAKYVNIERKGVQ